MSESSRVDTAAKWYLEGQLDFDRRLIGFRHRTIRPFFRGTRGLELGSAEGQMTRFLKDDFEELVIVDGAQELLDVIPDYPNVTKVHALFEEFAPERGFDVVIMEHILEHVADPVDILKRGRAWVNPGGRVIAGVPNARSFHRLAAVKMGLLARPDELNARDHAQGHRRVYDSESFRRDIETAGYKVVHMGGVYFKPLSNQQIQDHWDERMLEGFYELGKDFPENTADLFAVCEL
jgi:2-polyprenyl-3-methyl-5-hydroxy-6-metoxy-1,4-benzoquinol methylase